MSRNIYMFGSPGFRGQEVKEAVRAQMEVQRRLFERVEVTKFLTTEHSTIPLASLSDSSKSFCWLFHQVQKNGKAAYQKYIDPLLAKAYKIASEKIGLNSLSTTKRELLDMATRAICSPYDTLGVSDIHRLLVNSVKLALPWLQDDPLVRHRWLVPSCMINGETPKASLQICIATDNDRGQNITLQLLIAFYC
ncbi:hypothetical protein B296_00000891 [Ensete ventricosum]|uniref:MYB-CC type transcription factor LHEQLE-containing domain-containing protein n=1 Tax=Ensete ventricosum TaxID=4639 RepID=A0A427AVI1_ENSVE|nr:hypothetical protein B296_00000891 [Ensete ventricosum]